MNNKKVNIINSSIEDYNFEKKYDVVIMENVLEHCFDIDIIFNKIYNILNDDGLFIFTDSCIKNEYIKDLVFSIYDAGHPLRITEKN